MNLTTDIQITHSPITLSGQKALIVEDDENLRNRLKISMEDLGCLVTDVGDGEQAHKLLSRHQFDIAIIDMFIPKRSVQDLLALAHMSGTTLIAISGDAQIDARDAYQHGAHVFIRKPFHINDIIHAAARHTKIVSQDCGRVRLSNREQQILQLIHKGYETQQIAIMLHISPNTVWHHRKALKRKHNHVSFFEICSLYFGK